MSIPESWHVALERRQHLEPSVKLSALERVQRAIAAARAGNADQSINDIVGAIGALKFESKVEAVLRDLSIINDAVQRVIERVEDGGFADPVLVAALRMYPPTAGADSIQHADNIVALIQMIGKLPVEPEAEPHRDRPTLGRPAPHRSDPTIRAAVRAAMHCCFDETGTFAGGWRSNRTKSTGKSRGDEEFSLKGAAAYIANLVREAGVAANLRDIKGYMEEYAKELRKSNRPPVVEDYIEQFPDL